MENFEHKEQAARERLKPQQEAFVHAVEKELAEMLRSGRITDAQAKEKIDSAKDVDVALSEYDAVLYAWDGIATEEERKDLVEISDREKAGRKQKEKEDQ